MLDENTILQNEARTSLRVLNAILAVPEISTEPKQNPGEERDVPKLSQTYAACYDLRRIGLLACLVRPVRAAVWLRLCCSARPAEVPIQPL